MKKTPTIAIRVPLKGYKVQTMKETTKKVSGKSVIKKTLTNYKRPRIN